MTRDYLASHAQDDRHSASGVRVSHDIIVMSSVSCLNLEFEVNSLNEYRLE